MKKIFTIDGAKYTVITCTAVASCDMDTGDLQNALLVINYQNGEKVEKLVFGYDMPETVEDFLDMADDSSAWEFVGENRKTINERKVYYMADDDYIPAIYIDAPVCIDRAEVERLAREWDMTTEELLEEMHEATADEIDEFGVYDT